MQFRLLTCMFGAAAIVLATPCLFAHGGTYRGPPDIVPPPGGDGPPNPNTPTGPRDPSTPTGPRTPRGSSNPAQPAPPTGGPPQPRGPRSGSSPRTPRGIQLTPDLAVWTHWWEFNKHAYIGLREAVHTGAGPITGDPMIYMGPRAKRQTNKVAPTRRQILEEILPALKKSIDSTEQRDIVSSCMVAMAKIGENHPEFELIDVFRPRLARGDQEIRETAALAMGIAAIAGNGALDTLVDIALDNDAARQLRGGSLSVRTRSFALYGLGLLANEHTDPAIKQRALDTLRAVLEDKRLSNRNLKVAAINGIGMLAIDRVDAGSSALLDEAVDTLWNYYRAPMRAGQQLIQSHCPPAITKLLGRDHVRSDEMRQAFADELENPSKKRRSHDLARSCVLALGQLVEPYEDKNSADAGYSKLLRETFENHKDAQTRHFALLALGQIGGDMNRTFLLRILRKGRKALERPWAAIGLGVYSHAKYQEQEANDVTPTADLGIGNALTEQLESAKAPLLIGALGIALGLNKHVDAAPLMQQIIRDAPHKEEQAGYLCLGLALMRSHGSIETIRDTMEASTRRQQLFVRSAIALGVLGDKKAADDLHRKFGEESVNLATLAAIAEALGQIGDRRSVEPLKKALFDSDRSDLQRAFAAVALGSVADRAMLPWHAEVSTNMNYRAAVETLTNQQSGVLDIL